MDFLNSRTTEVTQKIGLSCSGGGVRALLFHLGVARYLAKTGRWEKISVLSSVSGGSLFVALLYASNDGKWPKAEELVPLINGKIKQRLTESSLQNRLIWRLLTRPWLLLAPRAKVLAEVLEAEWKLTQCLQDLPDTPEILINATTYETGKNWRFSKKRMGDYLTGYILKPRFPLSQAAAASAAYPGLIGPLRVNLRDQVIEPAEYASISNKPKIADQRFWLWDGGVYENLGVEALFKNRNLQNETDFLIVSDASAPLGFGTRGWTWKPPFLKSATRLTEIAMDQTRALRARDLLATFSSDRNKGRYIYIANSVVTIYQRAKKDLPLGQNHLNDADVKRCFHFPTNLKSVSSLDFDLIVLHGEQVAAATFDAWS
jgi:NTE family protein